METARFSPLLARVAATDVRPKSSQRGPGDLDLDTSIEECSIALKLFLNNKFKEARERMQPHADVSMYHALGYGTILYIQAVMTFDTADIEAAIQTIKQSIIVCSKLRKRTSMIGSLTKATSKPNYNDLTEEEIHAELCYAECLLIRALLTFIQDENLISFVRGGLKIRECYKIYKECNKILANRRFRDEKHRMHFESGVKMGVGAFNLMISLLPSKIMKLLEFVGFSGNKNYGLLELEKGSNLSASLRGPLCSIILIAYHTVVTYVLGLADGDIEFASDVLEPCLQKFPKGALFLFFAGRVQEVRGNLDEAIVKFEESIDSQGEWRQFHHLCFWELMWCHRWHYQHKSTLGSADSATCHQTNFFKADWLMAMKYAERLCRESRWSKATYTYQKASFLMMCDDQTEETQAHIAYLFSQVPKLKQRIAGKSLPFEKFAVAKAKRFEEQGQYLVLPALELIYVWNGFNIIGKKQELLERMLMVIEDTINRTVERKGDAPKFYTDNYCLLLLLKGVCLRHRDQSFQSEQCFLEIMENEKSIKEDTFLVPYALVEMAILYLRMDRLEDAKKCMEKARKNYKGYYLESRLHFRLHASRLMLTSAQNSDLEASTSSAPESPALDHCPFPPDSPSSEGAVGEAV